MPSPDQPPDEPIFPHLVNAGFNFLAGNLFGASESIVRAYQAIPEYHDPFGESNVLFLDRLPDGITEPEVAALTAVHAKPLRIKIPPGVQGGALAFVQFATAADAAAAAAQLNGTTPHGRELFARVMKQEFADREFPPQPS